MYIITKLFMKRYNLNRRLFETRNMYLADFYEFNDLLSKNGWNVVEFIDLNNNGKQYTGIKVYNKRNKNNPRYVSSKKLIKILDDYFNSNIDFIQSTDEYAPEISYLTVVVDSDIFDYADDQLEFDFNESKKIKTLSRFRESQNGTAFILAVNLKNGEKVPLGIWCDNHDLLHKAEDYIRYEYGNMNVYTFDILYDVEREGKKAYSEKTKKRYTIKKNAKNIK